MSAGADAFLHKPLGRSSSSTSSSALAGARERGPVRPRRCGGPAAGRRSCSPRDLRSLLEIERGQRAAAPTRLPADRDRARRPRSSRRTRAPKAHSKRVQRYRFCSRAAVDPLLIDDPSVEYGFLLHDVGKIGIPDHILQKPGPLDTGAAPDGDAHVMGEQMLADVELLHGSGIKVVRSHHERWDGGGYPDGLADERSRSARAIFAVADTLDAITSDRPYRPPALGRCGPEIERNAGHAVRPGDRRGFCRLRALAPRDPRDCSPPLDLARVASSTARRTRTCTRWLRYSALPFVSLGGSVPSAAARAPASAAGRRSAASTAVARSGVAPMLVSAIAGSPTAAVRARATAATPTVAQSCARRRNFRYAQPAPASFGTRISVTSSSGPRRSRRRRGRTRAAATVRSPSGPR